jgi:hypothetical protein
MRPRKPHVRADDRLLDITQAAWGRSRNIIRIDEVRDPVYVFSDYISRCYNNGQNLQPVKLHVSHSRIFVTRITF